MSPALPILKPRVILAALLKADFFIHHQTGSHVQLRHQFKKNLRITVPRHDKFDIPRPIIKSILRQAELSIEEFLDLL